MTVTEKASIDLNPMSPKWHPEKPRIYLESEGHTTQWLADRHSTNTVLEYNRWAGPADLPERQERGEVGDFEITRHIVLMECDHNQILKINEEMYKGSVHVVLCLEASRNVA